jgi:large subunit ribosomal protein L37Ae
MPKTKGLGGQKRFGARYGRRVREAFIKVENEQRAKHKCPYCRKIAVDFKAIGIWHCKKCDAKFTGKAYSPTKKILTKIGKELKAEALLAKVQ